MGTAKPLTEEQKKRAQQLARQRSADGGDNAPQRALQDMMDGIVKKEGIIEVATDAVPREPWMDTTPPRDLTVAEKKMLKDVEKKEQAFRDERLTLRRQTLAN